MKYYQHIPMDVNSDIKAKSCFSMAETTHSVNDDTLPGLTSAWDWPLESGATSSLWRRVAAEIDQWGKRGGLIPTQITVVLPFVQVISPLRKAWQQELGDGLIPRIETTQTWAARLGGVHYPGAGPCADPVLDHLQAQSWLRRLEQGQTLDLANALVEPLVTMANDLMQAAGTLAPQERAAYWQQAGQLAEQPQPGVAGVEAALGPLAVAWASATEVWATDILFALADNVSALSQQRTALVVVQAGGPDALTQNLYACWPQQQRLWLNLDLFLSQQAHVQSTPDMFKRMEVQTDPLAVIAKEHSPVWQIASDAEDEAERAAAEVVNLLNAGVMPVALCSQDRPIARRVRALLSRQGVALADETGWTLSTTRSAALVMSLVRSGLWDAPADTLLDAFKALPPNHEFTCGLDMLEACIRKQEVPKWPYEARPGWPLAAQQVLRRINDLVTTLRGTGQRSLWAHLQVFDQVLEQCGAKAFLLRDAAGIEALQILHCHELSAQSEADAEHVLSDFARQAQAVSMNYADFVRWVAHALETVTFIPPAPEQPQVVITPLARVMLRPFAAIVIPGCDETRLTAAPSLPGFWRESDRIALGLASRKRWWQRLQAQWVQALRLPRVSLIWRSMEGSQPLRPATLVQRLLNAEAEGGMQLSDQQPDQRTMRLLEAQSTPVPAPRPAKRLQVDMLSASAYQALRNCPYRFYALYMMQLREPDELDSELDQRDYGNWLHAVLKQFHEQRAQQNFPCTMASDTELLNACAQQLSENYDQAALILWRARWPDISVAYLSWLHGYESEGGQFEQAELAMRSQLTDQITLQGRIDRLDKKRGAPVVIDYKTERRSKTRQRVNEPFEDVQLPFYALLMEGQMVKGRNAVGEVSQADAASAFYLSLDEREGNVEAFSVKDLVQDKQALRQGIVNDLQRLEDGFPADPIGQAQACAYCSAIGLCRKKYWEADAQPAFSVADTAATKGAVQTGKLHD